MTETVRKAAEAAPEAPKPAASALAAAEGAGRTLLFADDERSLRLLARLVLESNGYEVLLAEDGRQAVEVFRREGQRIALVLLDLEMPALTGLEALAEMAALDPTMVALLMTGHEPPPTPPALAAIIRGVLCKPFGSEQLLRMLREALRK